MFLKTQKISKMQKTQNLQINNSRVVFVLNGVMTKRDAGSHHVMFGLVQGRGKKMINKH